MIVLDASVLLDVIWQRRRSTAVHAAINADPDRVVSAVQVAEVAGLTASRGGVWPRVERQLRNLGVRSVAFESGDGAATASEPQNVSLGDRCCLAFGHRRNATILTADAAWAGLQGVTVIR